MTSLELGSNCAGSLRMDVPVGDAGDVASKVTVLDGVSIAATEGRTI